MLVLGGATALVQLVTGQAVPVDVHASWVDIETATQIPNADSKNTAITTATTTTIVPSPATGFDRNIKLITIRNKHASTSVDITATHNDGTVTVEQLKITLAAGDTLVFSDSTTWWKIPNPVNAPNPSVGIADQAIGASVTNYITGSDIHISAGRPLRVGTVIRWHLSMKKTAAGTVAMTLDMRVGTAGTTADTSRASLSTGVQTGVADIAHVFVQCTVRSISASGVVHTMMELAHNLTSTGFAATPALEAEVTSAAFDTTATNLIFGLSLTTGASHAVTISQCVAEILDGTI